MFAALVLLFSDSLFLRGGNRNFLVDKIFKFFLKCDLAAAQDVLLALIQVKNRSKRCQYLILSGGPSCLNACQHRRQNARISR